jgi:uncharacterized circularly permuted ATP-grasp superfamily protein
MPRSLLANYPRHTARFDEMLDDGGELRPSWRAFFEHLGTASPELKRQHLDYVRRSILENGVT